MIHNFSVFFGGRPEQSGASLLRIPRTPEQISSRVKYIIYFIKLVIQINEIRALGKRIPFDNIENEKKKGSGVKFQLHGL